MLVVFSVNFAKRSANCSAPPQFTDPLCKHVAFGEKLRDAAEGSLVSLLEVILRYAAQEKLGP